MSSTAACLDAAAAYDKRKELLPAMTQRENILRLLHRQQYEFAPVDFSLCPKLNETYRPAAMSSRSSTTSSKPESTP